jgi:hypothetical protein
VVIDIVGSKMRTLGPKSGVAPVVGPPHVAVAVQLAGQLAVGTVDPEEAMDPEVLPALPVPVLPDGVEPLPVPPEAPLTAPDDGAPLTPDPTELPAPAPLADAPFPEAPEPLDIEELPDVTVELWVPDPAD